MRLKAETCRNMRSGRIAFRRRERVYQAAQGVFDQAGPLMEHSAGQGFIDGAEPAHVVRERDLGVLRHHDSVFQEAQRLKARAAAILVANEQTRIPFISEDGERVPGL